MKIVYVGQEGSGKTLLLGRETERLIYRNVRLAKQTGTMRPIVSNIAYSSRLIQLGKTLGVPIREWRDVAELETFEECDLFIDEIGTYFDSRTFSDLPLSTRLWLAQGQKRGVHIYGGTQDWGQVDISFRRLVSSLYEVKRLFGTRRPSKSIPGSRYPFALALKWKINPVSDIEKLKTIGLFPSLIMMTKVDTERFDTNARVPMSKAPPLVHIERFCQVCEKNHISHK